MKEGTVPVPPYRPALSVMMTYYMFGGYRILGEPERCIPTVAVCNPAPSRKKQKCNATVPCQTLLLQGKR